MFHHHSRSASRSQPPGVVPEPRGLCWPPVTRYPPTTPEKCSRPSLHWLPIQTPQQPNTKNIASFYAYNVREPPQYEVETKKTPKIGGFLLWCRRTSRAGPDSCVLPNLQRSG